MLITQFPKPTCDAQDNLATVFSKLITTEDDHIVGFNILQVRFERHVFTGTYRIVFDLAEPMRAHDVYPVSFPDEVDTVECYMEMGDNLSGYVMMVMGFILDCGLPALLGRYEAKDVARGFAIPTLDTMLAYYDEW